MVFVQKWPFLQLFFKQYIPGILFYAILGEKNAFLGYKKKKLKKWENFPFLQRGKPMVLVQKKRFFPTFFFTQYRAGKCLL